MAGFMTVEGQQEHYTYMPINGFTTIDIGCERGNNAYNIVNRLENPITAEYLKTFNAIWSDTNLLTLPLYLLQFWGEKKHFLNSDSI